MCGYVWVEFGLASLTNWIVLILECQRKPTLLLEEIVFQRLPKFKELKLERNSEAREWVNEMELERRNW